MKMLREITAAEYTCDGCGKVFLIERDAELPHGFHGNVTRISSWGGSGGDWFACTERCIRQAVLKAQE